MEVIKTYISPELTEENGLEQNEIKEPHYLTPEMVDAIKNVADVDELKAIFKSRSFNELRQKYATEECKYASDHVLLDYFLIVNIGNVIRFTICQKCGKTNLNHVQYCRMTKMNYWYEGEPLRTTEEAKNVFKYAINGNKFPEFKAYAISKDLYYDNCDKNMFNLWRSKGNMLDLVVR